MSDEQEEQATNESHDADKKDADKKGFASDELVTARWDVTVLHDENVSIHFKVEPNAATDAVTSVQASFVEKKGGVVEHSYGGSSAQELITPKEGQGLTGDCGLDVAAFTGRGDGDLFAVLAGTVKHGEETRNFFFTRQFHL